MPSHEEHCIHSEKRYGVRGDDIHTWIDEPCRTYGMGHRQYRHDKETIKLCGEIFGSIYGRAKAESIALDHLMADHEEDIRKEAIQEPIRYTSQDIQELRALNSRHVKDRSIFNKAIHSKWFWFLLILFVYFMGCGFGLIK